MNLKIATVSTIILATMMTGCIGDTSDEKIASIVEKTLEAKPEIIINALNNYRQREEAKQIEKQKAVLENATKNLKDDKHSLVLGNPDGDVTLIAFKDYRCGFCKKVWPTIQELIAKDKNLRVIFKEFPVLGPDSELASRFALATSLQGRDKYVAFNDALMTHQGPWNAETLKEIAKSKGIDADKMEKDAGEKFVSDGIAENMKLGGDLAIQGTPAFVIGKQVIPGAVPLDFLQNAIKEARAAAKAPAVAPAKEAEPAKAEPVKAEPAKAEPAKAE
jgi:protein-disulfide isomerase